MRKSKFLQLSYKFKILKKFYLFYNLYIRNRKYLNNGSQFGEDKFLYNLFEKNYVGKYLDVGCFHPTKHNNTSLFYKNGWQGINIDLNPLTIDLFNFMRPNDININTAVSSEESEKTLFFLSENNTQNTLSENQLLFLKKHHNLRDEEIIKKKIQTRRLDKILEENNFDNIDFMNLDVEGHELEVLKTINFKKTKLKYICIEMINHNNLSIKNSDQILDLLETNKFEQLKKFEFNYIFKNKEL
jgi:FkbM family methyltransferase